MTTRYTPFYNLWTIPPGATGGTIDVERPATRVTALTYHSDLLLEKAGAIVTDQPVERDGLIITASGPGASSRFGEAIVAALEE